MSEETTEETTEEEVVEETTPATDAPEEDVVKKQLKLLNQLQRSKRVSLRNTCQGVFAF